MLLANIKDQCKRKRQGKHIFPCKTGELVLCIKSRKKIIEAKGIIVMILVTFIAIQYSKKIYELHSLLFFSKANCVYEFMVYRHRY